MTDLALLKALSEAHGISGKEDAVRKIILEGIDGNAQDIRIDPMGSITARRLGNEGATNRVMLAAHMDEVGFMVTGVDGDGLIRFAAVGGIDDRILPALRVRIGANALPGVIIWTPIHFGRDQNVVKINSLRIDIGTNSKDEANGKVKIGDMIVFDSYFAELNGGMLRGKAFDDRAGCALLIETLRGDAYPVDVFAAFTVQEEIGLRGAIVAAQTLKPDLAIVLETTTANDLPNALADADSPEELNPTCRVLSGPVLTIMDSSIIVQPPWLAFARATAEKHNIPYQLKTKPGGGTDGGSIHVSNSGVPTLIVSLPARYIHSPVAYIHQQDFDNALRLIKALLNDLEESGL
jgi:tetrahedral aminopeptidase